MLPPLKSSNFVGLKEELEATGDVTISPAASSNIHHFCLQALWTQCSAGQNDALTEKLAEVFRIFLGMEIRRSAQKAMSYINMFV